MVGEDTNHGKTPTMGRHQPWKDTNNEKHQSWMIPTMQL